jgi:hypothetical protein
MAALERMPASARATARQVEDGWQAGKRERNQQVEQVQEGAARAGVTAR